MFVIVYHLKPATLEKLAEIEQSRQEVESAIKDTYITARTKRQCVSTFIYYFGYTWKERSAWIECVHYSSL